MLTPANRRKLGYTTFLVGASCMLAAAAASGAAGWRICIFAAMMTFGMVNIAIDAAPDFNCRNRWLVGSILAATLVFPALTLVAEPRFGLGSWTAYVSSAIIAAMGVLTAVYFAVAQVPESPSSAAPVVRDKPSDAGG